MSEGILWAPRTFAKCRHVLRRELIADLTRGAFRKAFQTLANAESSRAGKQDRLPLFMARRLGAIEAGDLADSPIVSALKPQRRYRRPYVSAFPRVSQGILLARLRARSGRAEPHQGKNYPEERRKIRAFKEKAHHPEQDEAHIGGGEVWDPTRDIGRSRPSLENLHCDIAIQRKKVGKHRQAHTHG